MMTTESAICCSFAGVCSFFGIYRPNDCLSHGACSWSASGVYVRRLSKNHRWTCFDSAVYRASVCRHNRVGFDGDHEIDLLLICFFVIYRSLRSHCRLSSFACGPCSCCDSQTCSCVASLREIDSDCFFDDLVSCLRLRIYATPWVG